MYWYRLRNAEAERYAQEAVDDAVAAPGRHGARDGLQQHGPAEDARRGHRDGAEKWGNRAIELARAFGDVDTEVHALNNVGTALMIAGDERGETILRESLDTALAHDLQEHVARAYTNLGATLVKHRRYAAGEDVVRRASPSAPTGTSTRGRPTCAGPCPSCFSRPGAGPRRGRSRTPPPTGTAATVSSVNALMVLGRLGTRTGTDPTAAAEAWRVAEPSGEPQRVLICAAGLAEAAWTRDDPDDVRRRVDAVWALAVERGGPWYLGELLWWLHCAGETRAAPQPVAEPFALMVAGDAARGRGGVGRHRQPVLGGAGPGGSDDPADLRAATAGFEALGATATHAAVVRDLRRRRTRCPGTPRVQPCQPRGPDRTRDGGPARARRGPVQRRDRRPLRPVGEDGRATTCRRCCASCRSPRARARSPPPSGRV